jgi:hypothetical protein
MWNVKTKVVPVIIGTTLAISESFRKYLSNVPGKHDIKDLQKTGILSTVHVNQSTKQKYKMSKLGNSIKCTIM